VNNELERIFKETVEARHSPGGTEENHEKLCQNSRSLGRDLNSGTPEAGVLTGRPRRSVKRRKYDVASKILKGKLIRFTEYLYECCVTTCHLTAAL
jgi:hypothetical protein